MIFKSALIIAILDFIQNLISVTEAIFIASKSLVARIVVLGATPAGTLNLMAAEPFFLSVVSISDIIDSCPTHLASHLSSSVSVVSAATASSGTFKALRKI